METLSRNLLVALALNVQWTFAAAGLHRIYAKPCQVQHGTAYAPC
jgi:hypothetical protein